MCHRPESSETLRRLFAPLRRLIGPLETQERKRFSRGAFRGQER